MNKLSEDISSTGSTSAGSISTVSKPLGDKGLNYSLLKRLPSTDVYGYSTYKDNDKKK